MAATLRYKHHSHHHHYHHNNTSYLLNQSNSINQQTFTVYKHHGKVSPSRRLKNLLKPLLGRVFKSKTKQPKRNSYIASDEKETEFEWLANDMDNMANEHLERQLIDELQRYDANDNEHNAIIVYAADGSEQHVMPVDQENLYVPVHFARTNAGTFFWTSMQRDTIEPYNIEWNFMDRWAQA